MGALKPDLLRNPKMDLSVPRDVRHRRLLTVTGVAGIAYTLSWIAGLAAVAYLLLLPGLADLAYVSRPLLLLFITGTGLALA